jgi:hypothetical protein
VLLHQRLGALIGEAALELRRVADLLVLGGLRDQHHVAVEGDEIVALGLGGHLREVAAKVFLDHGEVAGAHVGAVDLGDHRIGILGADGAEWHREQHRESER